MVVIIVLIRTENPFIVLKLYLLREVSTYGGLRGRQGP